MTQVEIDKYKNALVEVEAVLDCLEQEAYEKIPDNIIQAIEENKNENYEFGYDEDEDYIKWNLSKEAKAILYNIYKKYIANEEERKYFKDKEKFEIMQLEKQKAQKYNPDDVFKNIAKTTITDKPKEEHKELIKVEKEKWYVKIFNKIKRLFGRG